MSMTKCADGKEEMMEPKMSGGMGKFKPKGKGKKKATKKAPPMQKYDAFYGMK